MILCVYAFSLARIGKDALLMPTTRMFEEKLKSVVNVLAGYGDYNPQERMVPTVELVQQKRLSS